MILSAILGLSTALFIVLISGVVTYLSLKMDPKTGIMLAQSSFLIKLALSGIICGGIAYGLPSIDLMVFGLCYGGVICTALPILAIIQTR